VTDNRERAGSDIHDLLPAGSRVPPRALHDPATGRWHVTAIGPKLGGRRGPPPDYITGDGEDELAALVDLVLRLRDGAKAEKLAEIDRRGRARSSREPRSSRSDRWGGR
jgi:hypothetical protein